MATAYTLTFNGPTKIWSRTGTGIISWPSTITHPAGGPYIVVPTSIPFDPIHETGGSFWVLKGGPHVGFLVSFWSNSLGYGDITIGNDATEPRVSGTPHVNALADWRVLIKDLGGGTAGGHLLTFNTTTAIWSRTTGGIISWPSTLDAAPGGPFRVNPIVVPFDPIHETGGSFWELKEGPNRGFLVSFHSNSLGYGDIGVTDGPLNRGPGPVLATFYHPNPHLAGASMNYNAAGEFHMTLLVDDPNILVPKPKETHYAVEFRDADSDEWVEVFAGMIWDIDGTETEVVFYGIDYLALYQYVVDDRFDPGALERPAPNGSKYVQKTITEIVTAQLQYSKDLANSPVGFINIGEITATMGYVVTIYSTFHNTMEFIVGLLNSHRAGTGKFTRLSVEKTDAGEYEIIVVDDPGVTRDELRLQYGDLVQGYRAIPFGTDWASRVNFVGRSRDGLKVMFQTVNSPADELRWGRISQAPVYEESVDPADLRRRALQASIDASRLGRQIGVGTKLGSYRPFEGYRLCDMVVVDINHGAVQTQDWGNDTFGSDPSGDPSEVRAALWAIVGIQWESYDDGHWITTPLLFPKGLGKVTAADCSTVLGEVVFAVATGHGSVGIETPLFPTVDITPADTDPVVLLSYVTAVGGDTPEGHALLVPTDYTAMDNGALAGTSGGPSDPAWGLARGVIPFRAAYRALDAPTLTPYTAASQYLQGYGGTGWVAIQVAIHTAATAPVQSQHTEFLGGAITALLDTPPTPGNILVAFVSAQNSVSITAADAGWTEIGTQSVPHDYDPTRFRVVSVFVRCYSAGEGSGPDPDGTEWGFVASLQASMVHLTEWAITGSSGDSGASGTMSPTYSLSMHGSVDPTTGDGVAAAMHAIYTRDSDGVTWMKIGPLDTDWRQLAFV